MEEETMWDKEDIYDEQISPLMSQIIAICEEHNIPHVASFFIGGEEGDLLCTTCNIAHDNTPDGFKEAVKAIRGEPAFVAAITVTSR